MSSNASSILSSWLSMVIFFTKVWITIELVCEGGINIKKLVSGENQQVEPNFRKVLRIKCSVDKKAPFDVHYVRFQESEKKLKT